MSDNESWASRQQCPVCGYYCAGKGGIGCIDKPELLRIEERGVTCKDCGTVLAPFPAANDPVKTFYDCPVCRPKRLEKFMRQFITTPANQPASETLKDKTAPERDAWEVERLCEEAADYLAAHCTITTRQYAKSVRAVLAERKRYREIEDVLRRMTPLFRAVGDKHLDWEVHSGALEIKQAEQLLTPRETT